MRNRPQFKLVTYHSQTLDKDIVLTRGALSNVVNKHKSHGLGRADFVLAIHNHNKLDSSEKRRLWEELINKPPSFLKRMLDRMPRVTHVLEVPAKAKGQNR